MKVRLAKYLAMTGLCSRRAATRHIRDGRVQFNDRLANHIDTVKLIKREPDSEQSGFYCEDRILFDQRPIGAIESKSYWLLNKAVGTDCRLLTDDPSSLLHLLPPSPRLYPVGRLDKDSRGLLLLTNDGELTQRLMHPRFNHKKTYHVQLDRDFDDSFLTQMAAGVRYKDQLTLPCQTRRLSQNRFEIILTQGLNRQIRRMAQALGYRVIDLQRVAIQGLQLGDLAEGEKRPLNSAELSTLISVLAQY